MESTSGLDSMALFFQSKETLKRLKSKRSTSEVLIRELLFAGDVAIVVHSEFALQRLTDHLGEACDFFKMII